MTPQEQKAEIIQCLAATDDFEGTYGKLWRAIQGKSEPKPWAWSVGPKQKQKPAQYGEVMAWVGKDWQTTSQIMKNTGIDYQRIHRALTFGEQERRVECRRTEAGNCREREWRKVPEKTTQEILLGILSAEWQSTGELVAQANRSRGNVSDILRRMSADGSAISMPGPQQSLLWRRADNGKA